MKTYISMLRGINVSGQKKIRMADLNDLYKSMNFANIKTYVQSGNVVFGSGENDSEKLAQEIETEIAKNYGYPVSVFIRTAEDFNRILQNNPFLNERKAEPAKLHVTFLNRIPSDLEISNFKPPVNSGDDEFSFGEQEIYVYCPNGYGRTKLNNNFFERKLNIPATTRNWKTVNTLFEMGLE